MSDGWDGTDRRRPMNEGARAVLARLDERSERLTEDIADIKRNMVTKAEFQPFKVGIFAVVGSVVTAFGAAVVGALFHTKGTP